MQNEPAAVLRAIYEKAFSPEGKPFRAALAELAAAGVMRYRIDLAAGSITAYLGSGVHVEPIPADAIPQAVGAADWNESTIAAAIADTVTGKAEGGLRAFMRTAASAGVTDYMVYIAGKRVVYSGALGDSYTFLFPSS